MALDGGGFGYTALVIDAFAGLIPGWECSLSKETAFVERAIRQATAYRPGKATRLTGTLFTIPMREARADSTGRRNTSVMEVCDGTGQEAVAAGAGGCPAAVGGGSGVAAADAVTGPA